MSFILDALRKAEEERQRGAAPTLTTQHFAERERKPDPRWWYLTAGVVSLAALGAAWMVLWKPQSEPLGTPTVAQTSKAPAASSSVAASLDAHTAGALSAETRSPDAKAPVLPSPAASSPAAPPVAAASPALPRPSVAPTPEKPVQAKAEKPAKAAPSPRPAEPQAAPAPQTVVSLSELPAALRQELPKIVVSGYSHSADASVRMAVINDRMFREGEEVADGLKVQQISPGGIVFSYKGYRFRSGSL